MSLNEDTRLRYEKRILDVMKEEGDKKLLCDFLSKKIGISKDYVLQLMKSMADKGLVEFELAKRAPEKKSWIRPLSSG